jgi:hypothetical protein
VCTENFSSGVVVMKSAQNGARPDHTGSLNRARKGRIFVQGQVCSRLIMVVSIRFQNPAQMCLAQDNAQVRLAYCYSGRSRDLAAVSKRRVHARQDR